MLINIMIIIMKYSEMGSSISKYDDLELSTAEGGLEPLPTGPSPIVIIKITIFIIKMMIFNA